MQDDGRNQWREFGSTLRASGGVRVLFSCPENIEMSKFGGHGMMHAPAAGRAIAELITHGEFTTIDLTRFSCERVVRREPYRAMGFCEIASSVPHRRAMR